MVNGIQIQPLFDHESWNMNQAVLNNQQRTNNAMEA
jgi:hypothetical protein